MSDDIDHTTPQDDSHLLAAEYVLGVLPADGRRAVETRMGLEPALAREVESWEERLGGMASYVTSVPPPSQMWLRIEAALRAAPSRVGPSTSIVDSLLFWRLLALGSSALAAACLAGLVYFATLSPPLPRVPLMATLGAVNTGQPRFLAAISSDGSSLTIVPATALSTDKRSMELWLIPQGGQPQSLGLISPAQMVRMNVPPALIERARAGATLAVSLEPPGGSPTGQPTGDMMAAGQLIRL